LVDASRELERDTVLERFTEKARRLLMFARYEARQLGDNSIAGEHLLLALLREPEIEALAATRDVSLANIRDEIAHGNRRLADPDPDDDGLGEEARRILRFAGDEADAAAERLVDARHVLFAILRDGRSLAASLLTAHGITLGFARRESQTPLVQRAPGVYIAPTELRSDEARETGSDEAWALEGFTVTQALSRAGARGLLPFPESRIALPSSVDARARYDFVLVLTPGKHDDRGELMLRGIERHFGMAVEVAKKVTDVYVLTAVAGAHASLKRSAEEGGGGMSHFSVQFSMADPDGMPPTLEAFQARFPTPASWREAMAAAAIESVSLSNGSMEFFCHTLEEALGRPVVDETGLDGGYDIELSGERGELIDRLRRELGLVLTPDRRPVAWLNVGASG
jgi:uncharacterized protein (TIGR03435 family)